MSVEDLLKPRYKVIADWPNMDNDNLGLGDIITVGQTFYIADEWVKWFEKWPHLFKKLEWWEERKEDEMPEYVKSVLEGKLLGVWKIIRWNLEEGRGYINDYQVISLGFLATEPATQSEFDAQRTGSTSE